MEYPLKFAKTLGLEELEVSQFGMTKTLSVIFQTTVSIFNQPKKKNKKTFRWLVIKTNLHFSKNILTQTRLKKKARFVRNNILSLDPSKSNILIDRNDSIEQMSDSRLEEELRKFDLVVVSQTSFHLTVIFVPKKILLIKIDLICFQPSKFRFAEICHKNTIPFIYAQVSGLYGYYAVDFQNHYFQS